MNTALYLEQERRRWAFGDRAEGPVFVGIDSLYALTPPSG